MSTPASRRGRRGARRCAPRWPTPQLQRRSRCDYINLHGTGYAATTMPPRIWPCAAVFGHAAPVQFHQGRTPATRLVPPAQWRPRSRCWRCAHGSAAARPALRAARPGAAGELPASAAEQRAAVGGVTSTRSASAAATRAWCSEPHDERRCDVAACPSPVSAVARARASSDWEQAAPMLRSERHGRPGEPLLSCAPNRLPSNERRRAAPRGIEGGDRWPIQARVRWPAPVRCATGVHLEQRRRRNCAMRACAKRWPTERHGVADALHATRCTTPSAGCWHIAVAIRAWHRLAWRAYDSAGARLVKRGMRCVPAVAAGALVAQRLALPTPLHAPRPLPDHVCAARCCCAPRQPDARGAWFQLSAGAMRQATRLRRSPSSDALPLSPGRARSLRTALDSPARNRLVSIAARWPHGGST